MWPPLSAPGAPPSPPPSPPSPLPSSHPYTPVGSGRIQHSAFRIRPTAFTSEPILIRSRLINNAVSLSRFPIFCHRFLLDGPLGGPRLMVIVKIRLTQDRVAPMKPGLWYQIPTPRSPPSLSPFCPCMGEGRFSPRQPPSAWRSRPPCLTAGGAPLGQPPRRRRDALMPPSS